MSAGRHVSRPKTSYQDGRGTIKDLLQGETIDAVSVITSRKGAVRGNHYHQETLQVLYIVSGKIRLVTQMPGEATESATAEAGDLVRTPPIERHAIVALDDTVFVVFTRGPRGGADFESDTYRLEEPLVPPQR